MPNKRKQERLPEGMALVETADGRWFAAFASLVKRAHRGYVLVDPPLIPPALDSFHERGPDYDCREGALAACNAWYLDEITQLAGGDIPRLHCGIFVHAMVLARQTTGNEVITAIGNTPDEAIETLYQRMYQWSCKLRDTPCES